MSDDDVPLIGHIKDKLIETKQKWAREGRALVGAGHDPARPRLPPGQRRVADFPVLDLGIQPAIAEADWSLTIGGLVERPLRWSWQDFLAQPQAEIVTDIHCVTTWSRYDNLWKGVPARYLLVEAGVKPEAKFLLFTSYDGYTTNVPLAHFDDEDVLLAHSWQGQPLAREHGGPVRVVIPKLYFWKSAKWVRRIDFLETDKPGFWEQRGYHELGDPWAEQRYSDD